MPRFKKKFYMFFYLWEVHPNIVTIYTICSMMTCVKCSYSSFKNPFTSINFKVRKVTIYRIHSTCKLYLTKLFCILQKDNCKNYNFVPRTFTDILYFGFINFRHFLKVRFFCFFILFFTKLKQSAKISLFFHKNFSL